MSSVSTVEVQGLTAKDSERRTREAQWRIYIHINTLKVQRATKPSGETSEQHSEQQSQVAEHPSSILLFCDVEKLLFSFQLEMY